MRNWMFALALLVSAPVMASETLDNNAVVEMVKLGLDPQVIDAKIDASASQFDTSPAALAKLKHQGVPSAVISKMIQAGSASGGGNGGTASTAAASESFEFVNASGTHAAMAPVRVTAELSYRKAWIPFHVGGPETFMFLQGRHAATRTSATPEFVTNLDPLMVRLVRLGQKDDRDARYVVFSGSTTDREIQLTSTKVDNRSYSLKPNQALKAGEEYAFLVVSQMPVGAFWAYFAQNAATAKAYDFAVE